MDKKTQDLLIDYLHHALSGAERSALEDRLRADSDLRQQLSAMRQMQQSMQSAVSAEINDQLPSASMTFAGVSADVLARRTRSPLRTRLMSSLTAIAAIAVLLFAVIYSLPDQIDFPVEGNASTLAPPPISDDAITPTAPLTPTLTPGPSSIPSRPNSSIPPRENDSSIPTPNSNFFTDPVYLTEHLHKNKYNRQALQALPLTL